MKRILLKPVRSEMFWLAVLFAGVWAMAWSAAFALLVQ